MRALLDTHALIWLANGDPLLAPAAQSVVADSANEVFLSAVSTWEMAIKIAIGKLTLALPLDAFVASQFSLYPLKPLPITYDHTYQVERLPPHHKDPFDRLLVAQAIVENLIVLTGDQRISQYGVQTLW